MSGVWPIPYILDEIMPRADGKSASLPAGEHKLKIPCIKPVSDHIESFCP